MATLLTPPPQVKELKGAANSQQSNTKKASNAESGEGAGVKTCPYHHCPHHDQQAYHNHHSSEANAEMGGKAAKSDVTMEATSTIPPHFVKPGHDIPSHQHTASPGAPSHHGDGHSHHAVTSHHHGDSHEVTSRQHSSQGSPSHHHAGHESPLHHHAGHESPLHHHAGHESLSHHHAGHVSPSHHHVGHESPSHHHAGHESQSHHHAGHESPSHHHAGHESPSHHHVGHESPSHHHAGHESPSHHHVGHESPSHHHVGHESPSHHHVGHESPSHHHAGHENPSHHHAGHESPSHHHASHESPSHQHSSHGSLSHHHASHGSLSHHHAGHETLSHHHAGQESLSHHHASHGNMLPHHTSQQTSSPHHGATHENLYQHHGTAQESLFHHHGTIHDNSPHHHSAIHEVSPHHHKANPEVPTQLLSNSPYHNMGSSENPKTKDSDASSRKASTESKIPPAAGDAHTHGKEEKNSKGTKVNPVTGRPKIAGKELDTSKQANADNKTTGKGGNKDKPKGKKGQSEQFDDKKGKRKSPVFGSGDAATKPASERTSSEKVPSRPVTPEKRSSLKRKESENEKKAPESPPYIYTTEKSFEQSSKRPATQGHDNVQDTNIYYTTEKSHEQSLKRQTISGHDSHHHPSSRSDSFYTTEESFAKHYATPGREQSSTVGHAQFFTTEESFQATHPTGGIDKQSSNVDHGQFYTTEESFQVHKQNVGQSTTRQTGGIDKQSSNMDHGQFYTTEESFQVPKQNVGQSATHPTGGIDKQSSSVGHGQFFTTEESFQVPKQNVGQSAAHLKVDHNVFDESNKTPHSTAAPMQVPVEHHGTAQPEGHKIVIQPAVQITQHAPNVTSPQKETQFYTTEASFVSTSLPKESKSKDQHSSTNEPQHERPISTSEESYHMTRLAAQDEHLKTKATPQNTKQFYTTEESFQIRRQAHPMQSTEQDLPENVSSFQSPPPSTEEYSYTTEASYKPYKFQKQTAQPQPHLAPQEAEPIYTTEASYQLSGVSHPGTGQRQTKPEEETYYTTEQSFRFTPEKLFLPPENPVPIDDGGDIQGSLEKALPVVHMYHIPPGQTTLSPTFVYTPVEPGEKHSLSEKPHYTPGEPHLPPDYHIPGKQVSSTDQPIHSILPQKVPSTPEKVYLPEEVMSPEKKLSTPEKPQSKETEGTLPPVKKESASIPLTPEKETDAPAERKHSDDILNRRESMLKTNKSDTYGLGLPSSTIEGTPTRATHSGEQNVPLSEGYDEGETERPQSTEDFLEAQNRHLHFDDARTSSPILDTYSDDSMPRLVDDTLDVSYGTDHKESLSGASINEESFPEMVVGEVAETSPGKKSGSGRENIFILPEDQILFNMEDEPDPERRHEPVGFAEPSFADDSASDRNLAFDSASEKNLAFDSTFDTTSHSHETSLGLDLSGLDETFESIPEENAMYSPQTAANEILSPQSEHRTAVGSKTDLTPEERRGQKLLNKSEEAVGSSPMNVSPSSFYG